MAEGTDPHQPVDPGPVEGPVRPPAGPVARAAGAGQPGHPGGDGAGAQATGGRDRDRDLPQGTDPVGLGRSRPQVAAEVGARRLQAPTVAEVDAGGHAGVDAVAEGGQVLELLAVDRPPARPVAPGTGTEGILVGGHEALVLGQPGGDRVLVDERAGPPVDVDEGRGLPPVQVPSDLVALGRGPAQDGRALRVASHRVGGQPGDRDPQARGRGRRGGRGCGCSRRRRAAGARPPAAPTGRRARCRP